MRWGKAHVVGRALVAECRGDRRMDLKELRIREGDQQLRDSRAPFEAPVRHGPEIGHRQMTLGVGGIRCR